MELDLRFGLFSSRLTQALSPAANAVSIYYMGETQITLVLLKEGHITYAKALRCHIFFDAVNEFLTKLLGIETVL